MCVYSTGWVSRQIGRIVICLWLASERVVYVFATAGSRLPLFFLRNIPTRNSYRKSLVIKIFSSAWLCHQSYCRGMSVCRRVLVRKNLFLRDRQANQCQIWGKCSYSSYLHIFFFKILKFRLLISIFLTQDSVTVKISKNATPPTVFILFQPNLFYLFHVTVLTSYL